MIKGLSKLKNMPRLCQVLLCLEVVEEIVNIVIELLIMGTMLTVAMTPYPCCRDIAIAASTVTKELTC